MRIILNLAVGGDWGGQGVTDYSAFNAGVTLSVSGVRVYSG